MRAMKLADYIKEAGLTDEAFGRLVGVSQPTVSRLKRDLSWPTRETIERIRDVTGGKVTADDFMDAPTEAAG